MKKGRSGRRWTSAAFRRLADATGSEEIDEATARLVARFLDGVATAPTDLETLQARLGVAEATKEDLLGDGELRALDDGRFSIALSRYAPPARRRFTLAHELGHVMLLRVGERHSRGSKELEAICDKLATEILMPRDVFAATVPARPDLRALANVARTFRVSLETAVLRLCDVSDTRGFVTAGHNVVWGRGPVRRGPLRGYPHELEECVRSAAGFGGAILGCELDGWRVWRLEWAVNRDAERKLFLLRPADPREFPVATERARPTL